MSVVIASYNSGRVLLAAVASALGQDYSRVEVLVVDDASPDPAHLALLLELQANATAAGKPLRVLFKPNNTYLGDTRNYAAARARGAWLLFLDADDVLMPHAARTLLHAACHAGAAQTVARPVYFSSREPDEDEASTHWLALGGPVSAALWINSLGGPTSLVSADAFQALGGFMTDRTGGEDWEFNLRAALAGVRQEFLPGELYWYRTSNENSMSRQMDRKEVIRRASSALVEGLAPDVKRMLLIAQGLYESQFAEAA